MWLCEVDCGILVENISVCDDCLIDIYEYVVCVELGDLRLNFDERLSV